MYVIFLFSFFIALIGMGAASMPQHALNRAIFKLLVQITPKAYRILVGCHQFSTFNFPFSIYIYIYININIKE